MDEAGTDDEIDDAADGDTDSDSDVEADADADADDRVLVTVLLAHPDASKRALLERGLRRSDELEVTAAVADVDAAVDQAVDELPDVLAIPGGESLLTRVQRLQEEAPAVSVLVVDAGPDDFPALAAGATGALAPGASRIADAAFSVARGESLLPPEWAGSLTEAFDQLDERAHRRLVISDAEREVIDRIAAGETPRDIADSYEVSERLVNLHLGYVVAKYHRAVETGVVLAAHEAALDAGGPGSERGADDRRDTDDGGETDDGGDTDDGDETDDGGDAGEV